MDFSKPSETIEDIMKSQSAGERVATDYSESIVSTCKYIVSQLGSRDKEHTSYFDAGNEPSFITPTYVQTDKTRIILQIIIITLFAAFAVYYILGSSEKVHLVAFGILCVGFGYAIYLNGR